MTTLTSQIGAKNFDWINEYIVKHFKAEPLRGETKLFHFGRFVSSGKVTAEMAKEGCVPANISELLAYAWDEKGDVVALGSFMEINGDRYVPILVRRGARRGLGLGWFGGGWGSEYQFLAVHTLPSDTLTLVSLESRVKKLEDVFTTLKQSI